MAYKFVQDILKEADSGGGFLSTGMGTEGSLLIPAKIYGVLIGEVKKFLIDRSLAANYFGPADIPGSSVDVNLIVKDTLNLKKVGQGAEVALATPLFTTTNLKPEKYGIRMNITKEMEEDCQFNLIQEYIALAGKKFAENENSLILTALQRCTNSISGGSALAASDVTRGAQYLEDNDYAATDLLVGPEALKDLRDIDVFVSANRLGSTEMHDTGFVGTIYGMTVHKFSATAAPSTTYSKYVYVIDRNNAFMVAEKRPITVENYEITTHNLSGVVLTQRIAIALKRDYAVARISTS